MVESVHNLKKKTYLCKNVHKKIPIGTYRVSVRDWLGNVQSKKFTRTSTGILKETK